jgi:excisionase family DNA binding protein
MVTRITSIDDPSLHNTNRIAVSLSEAAQLAGVGRTFLYAAIANGDLKSAKIGSRRLIRLEALREWLAGHEG